MKKLLIALAVLASAILGNSATSLADGLTAREERRIARSEARKRGAKAAALNKVCTDISNLSGLLVKETAGGHIGRGDARYSGYSIICASKCVSFPAKVYHCDGTTAFSMGYYGRWSGNGKSRGYCAAGGVGACSVSSVKAAARSKRCGTTGYLDVDGSRGKKCMRMNIDGSRNGGV